MLTLGPLAENATGRQQYNFPASAPLPPPGQRPFPGARHGVHASISAPISTSPVKTNSYGARGPPISPYRNGPPGAPGAAPGLGGRGPPPIPPFAGATPAQRPPANDPYAAQQQQQQQQAPQQQPQAPMGQPTPPPGSVATPPPPSGTPDQVGALPSRRPGRRQYARDTAAYLAGDLGANGGGAPAPGGGHAHTQSAFYSPASAAASMGGHPGAAAGGGYGQPGAAGAQDLGSGPNGQFYSPAGGADPYASGGAQPVGAPGMQGGGYGQQGQQQQQQPATMAGMTNQFGQMGLGGGPASAQKMVNAANVNLINTPVNPLELMTVEPPEINLPANVRRLFFVLPVGGARRAATDASWPLPRAGLVLAVSDAQRRPVLPAHDDERRPDDQLAPAKVQGAARPRPDALPQPQARRRASSLSLSQTPLSALAVPPRSNAADALSPSCAQPEVPVVSDTVIARCRRCRTYINPYVTFIEGGQRWKCCMCNLSNEVPQLFDWDQDKNEPADRYARHELNSSVVEFVAPTEYMVRAPQPPIYVFVIDVSYSAVTSGMVATAARTLLESLDRLPNEDSRTKIAIIGVDSCLHFFTLAEGAAEPSMLVVGDLDDVFLPKPNDILVNLVEAKAGIENLLSRLNDMFVETHNTGNALGAGLQAAFKLISHVGGKVVALSASLPNLGPGALKPREDSKILGTSKESTLLAAQTGWYKSFAIECSRSQVSVDMWLFSSAYTDVATLSGLPRYTGGQTYYYPSFNAARSEDALKFAHEFGTVIADPICLEAVMRVRASRGASLSLSSPPSQRRAGG